MNPIDDPDLVAACRALVAWRADTPVAARTTDGGRGVATLADAHVPLMVDYTREDREAKGLRRLAGRETPAAPVPDTVLEAVGREPLLLLTGPSGCGKTTSLRHVAAWLAGQRLAESDTERTTAAPPGEAVVRNETGDVVAETWAGPAAIPLWIDARAPGGFADALIALGTAGRRIADRTLHAPVLLVVDGAERLGAAGSALLADAAAHVAALPGLRIVVAAEDGAARSWSVPAAFARRRIVGLIEPQRQALAARLRPACTPDAWRLSDAALRDHAGLFALALDAALPLAATPVAAVDRWLDAVATRNRVPVDALVEAAVTAFEAGDAAPDAAISDDADRAALARPFVQRELAARRLVRMSPVELAARHVSDPIRWSGPVALAARRRVAEDPREAEAMALALVEADDALDVREPTRGLATLTAATLLVRAEVDDGAASAVRRRLCDIVEQGRLSTSLRDQAGRALARVGDPRDLEALVEVPAGRFLMGSALHPNSAPEHWVEIAAPYRIGRYPVTNALYGAFVEATGRVWRSADGRLAERRNSPAGDLTWHDARVCCDWLTIRWRTTGRIGAADRVRLPTEAEWEHAARGVRGGHGLVFPWPGDWRPDRSNGEEAGLNDTCSVGLFPLGRSPHGCDDMAGQVWEWTSTLWGEDMATPRFRYPYRPDDGREALAAPPAVRRVLRGASFLGPRDKANCTYRGSLEPDGFWRGNGFRVVVATA